jgi:hypothetical protein
MLSIISCKPETAPPTTTSEIIEEISRDWEATAEGDDLSAPISFTATIASDPADQSKILITNFHNMGYTDKLTAIVFTDLNIEIPEQTIGNQIYKGSGEISNDLTQITWTYTIEYEGGILNNTATFTYGITS